MDLSWVFEALHSDEDSGPQLIGQTIDGVNQIIASRDFRLLDRVLEIFLAELASTHVLLTLARSTYPVRPKLNGWKPFTLGLKGVFDDRGLDAVRLLKGLID